MNSSSNVTAIDLGAESGRVISANFTGSQISLDIKHRFTNVPVTVQDTLYWDILRLWHEVQTGLNASFSDKPLSIGIDTWGLDFGLLDENGQLISNPIHYRDKSRIGTLDRISEVIPLEEIYETTGIQLMDINGVCQLFNLAKNSPKLIQNAKTFLTIPDLFNYFLTGERVCEFTNATTTQAYNPRQVNWAYDMLDKMDVPTHIFPQIIQPGTRIGNYKNIPVIAPACHDTGSAVAAVPAQTESYSYISSGTWSLIGIEVQSPIINQDSFTANLTNEGGVDNTYRLLKNVMGLWLLQQCRATWNSEGKPYEYCDLTEMAKNAVPFSTMFDPDHKSFLPPGNMPQRIREYCSNKGLPSPNDIGAMVRCILESLAFKYRYVMDLLVRVSNRPIDTIHIIGGGAQNELLCQMTANATNRLVVSGPVEATAIGNALVQWWSIGEIESIKEGREIVSHSFDLHYYEPINHPQWDEHYTKFLDLLE